MRYQNHASRMTSEIETWQADIAWETLSDEFWKLFFTNDQRHWKMTGGHHMRKMKRWGLQDIVHKWQTQLKHDKRTSPEKKSAMTSQNQLSQMTNETETWQVNIAWEKLSDEVWQLFWKNDKRNWNMTSGHHMRKIERWDLKTIFHKWQAKLKNAQWTSHEKN